MKLVEHQKLEDKKYEMSCYEEPSTFLAAVEKTYRRENKKISIQGFRKGKTPRAVIERMYGADFFYEDAVNDLLPNIFADAVKEADIEYIGRPEIDVLKMSIKEGLSVKFTVKLRPELIVKQYKGISGTKVIVPIDDKAVEDELSRMRDRVSRMVAIEDRPAQMGDTVTIDFEGFVNGVPFEGGKSENVDLTLGDEQFIPGFEEALNGHTAEEEFDINVTFPKEYGAADLAGKEAVFHIKLHTIRWKELPALDDEFAKEVSEFDTLTALKEDIRNKEQAHQDEHAKNDLENALVSSVAATLEGDIPEEMIEDRKDEMVRDFDYRLRSQNMDLETYLKYTGLDAKSFRETFKESAEKAVRTRLALEAVARAENIDVTDEDKEKEYEKLAKTYNMDSEKIRDVIPEKELIADVKVNKAIDVICAHAKVTEEIKKPEEEVNVTEGKGERKSKKSPSQNETLDQGEIDNSTQGEHKK